jgi:hypothetical protein
MRELIAVRVVIPAVLTASVIMVFMAVAAISITTVSVTTISRAVWVNYAAAEQDGQTEQNSEAFHDVLQDD